MRPPACLAVRAAAIVRARAPVFAIVLLAAAVLSGCYSTVSYPVSGSTTSSDEVWYVKQKYVLFLRVQHDVYYCPPGQVVSQKVCTKAVMHDDGE